MKIYLCGPINGCTDEECKNWREEAKRILPDTIDPMIRDYRGREYECWREIVEGDKADIERCDALLVNHPKPSVGTAMEIYMAWSAGKKIIVVTPEGAAISPWLRYHSHQIVHSFEAAYSTLK